MIENRNSETAPKKEGNEIVKRIEGPEEEESIISSPSYDESYYTDTTYEDREYFEQYDEEDKPSKRFFPLLAGVTTVGIIGYFGFNYFQQENKIVTQNRAVAGVIDTNTTAEKATKEELISFYVNKALDVKEKPETKTEETKVTEAVPTPTLPVSIQKEEMQRAEKEEPIEKETIVAKEEPVIVKQELKTEPVAIKQEIKEEPPKSVEKIATLEKHIAKTEEVQKEEPVVPKQTVKEVKKVKHQKIAYERIKPRVITVKEGDTLASIANRFYNNEMDFRRIIRANSKIRSSKSALHVGQKIIIPRKDGKTRRRYTIVEKGDTLASIAKKVYGEVTFVSKIVRANYKIKNSHSTIHIGQKIYIPK